VQDLEFAELPPELQALLGSEHKSLWSAPHNRRVFLRRFGYLPALPKRERPLVRGFRNQEEYDSYNFDSE
jgi:hypothetical protein